MSNKEELSRVSSAQLEQSSEQLLDNAVLPRAYEVPSAPSQQSLDAISAVSSSTDIFSGIKYFWYKENPFYNGTFSEGGTDYNAAWLLERISSSFTFNIVMFWYRSGSKTGGYLMTADYILKKGKNYLPKHPKFARYFNYLKLNENNYQGLYFDLIKNGMLFPVLTAELESGSIKKILNPSQRITARVYNAVSSLFGRSKQEPVDEYAGGKSRKRKAKNNKTRKPRK